MLIRPMRVEVSNVFRSDRSRKLRCRKDLLFRERRVISSTSRKRRFVFWTQIFANSRPYRKLRNNKELIWTIFDDLSSRRKHSCGKNSGRLHFSARMFSSITHIIHIIILFKYSRRVTGYYVFDKLALLFKFPTLSQRSMANFYTSNFKKRCQ